MEKNIPPVLRSSQSNTSINPLIAGRWSSRAIDPHRLVDDEVFNRLFEAARWAPSAANNQPWRYMTFGPGNAAELDRARKTLAAGNAWALDAPRLFFVLTRTDRPGSGRSNPRAAYEAGMATLQMALQAADEGLVFHQMAGFDADLVRSEFSVPENFDIIVAVVVGYPGDILGVPENKQSLEISERVRKTLSEIVFTHGAAPTE